MHTGMSKLLIFALDIPSSEIHKPRSHSMYNSLLFCNLDLLQQTHKIKRPSNILRGINYHIFIFLQLVLIPYP